MASDSSSRSKQNGGTNGTGLLDEVVSVLKSQAMRIPQDIGILVSAAQTMRDGGLIDDKKYLIERIIQLAASLPPESKAAVDLTGAFIKTLWEDLEHPPLSYLGDEFKYRTADGSNNNIMYPHLGKAGSPYARTVTTKTQVTGVLPDPSTIFDALFAREGPAREHPNKISSMLFYLASIIIHDIFRTNDRDWNKADCSSYLDLSPLYGYNEEQQNSVRTFQDGRLKPDTFAETRVLGFPPGVCAFIICFNRFHNFVVGQLAMINEAGRFSLPPGITPDNEEAYKAAQLKRDNDLFQTARLITCGLYINIILGDYVRAILNLNRSTSTWVLDPRGTFEEVFGEDGIPRGIGNQVSVEFNLIYRWHAAISRKDEQWANDFYNQLFPNQDPSTLSLEDFKNGLRKWSMSIEKDPGRRTFGGLTRKEDGAFEDSELVKIIQESTEDVAGAFGARNVPVVMKAIEILGMEQARKWQVATLNEFRKFFKLKPHATFKDINSNEDVAKSLEALYTHPDNVELYPGLVAEEAKQVKVPGSGLCPGYTVSKTILSDAVALVRGDRFYTVDYSPATLTNWGYNEIAGVPQIAGRGVMYKLLMRAFPGYYRGNSVYALFPFTVPEENRKILKDLGQEKDYDYGKPFLIDSPKPVVTWSGVTSVLKNQKDFKTPWGAHIRNLSGQDFMLSGDTPAHAEQKTWAMNAVYGPPKGLDQVSHFFDDLTRDVVHKHSHKLRRHYQLDIVRDVGNYSSTKFIAHLFHIPLKDSESSVGFTVEELYYVLAYQFIYVFMDLEPAKSFGLRAAAMQSSQKLGKVMREVCEAVSGDKISILKDVLGFGGEKILKDYGAKLIKRLFEDGKNLEEVVWTMIPTAAAAVGMQAPGFAQVMDLYLSDKYKSHWTEIQKLAQSDSPEALEKLKRYAYEGLRLATPAYGLFRDVAADSATIQDGDQTVSFKKGDKIWLNFVSACVDPEKFPDPYEVKLDRPYEDYIQFGYGAHECLGRLLVETAMPAQFRVLGRLKNLRRAPGPEGQMKSVDLHGFKLYMKEDWSDYWPFPTTMKVHFDDF